MQRQVYSNTSHVPIYPLGISLTDSEGNIQIHLMFLFIMLLIFTIIFIKLFKYISCSYLSRFEILLNIRLCDSNTSHVPIYLLSVLYSLYVFSHSNTSHVPIYLYAGNINDALKAFKYISCSYLSMY